MDRPVSPTSILNISDEDIQQLQEDQGIERWIEKAQIGFQYVREKLNKETINVGDGLLVFYNFDIINDDYELFVPLFCLAICFLESSKDSLNEIMPYTYKKLFEYTIHMYNTKSITYMQSI